MQYPLTSQWHGSVSQRGQLVLHYGSNSTPWLLQLLGNKMYHFEDIWQKKLRSKTKWLQSLMKQKGSKFETNK
jgi:hypothetical protein